MSQISCQYLEVSSEEGIVGGDKVGGESPAGTTPTGRVVKSEVLSLEVIQSITGGGGWRESCKC